jgi:alkylhydroperoxidase/carboxymuconolactone decarboxylase family protein YurZ
MSRVLDDFQKLDSYDPEFLDSLVGVRKSILPLEKKPAIPTKYKELIMVAVETAAGRGEHGISHARKAIRAGATPKEVYEALAICIYLTGMATWVDSGKYCLQAAEEEYEKVKRGEKFVWSGEVGSHGKK